MSSSEPFKLRAAKDGTRKYEALKFRERVPELEASQSKVRLERRGRVLASEEKFVLETKKRKYEGSHEAVGTSSQAASCYVALRVQDGVMTMMPLSDWYAFRPAVMHKTIGLDDAEALMEKTDKRSALRDQRVAALRKRDEDEEDAGPGRGGGGRGGGDSDDGGLDDGDAFDDGVGPAWAAGELHDEDGNDGLDMADEDLFEDDEDDSFEAAKARELQYGCVATDAAELDFHETVEETRHIDGERQRRQREGAFARTGGDATKLDAFLEDDEDDAAVGAGGARADGSEWAGMTKEVLKEERMRRRREEEDDDDDDDDDEALDDAEELAALLRREAANAVPEVAKKEERGHGDRKRPLAATSSSTEKPDRAKMAKVAEAAAARGGGTTTVDEKDLVMLLHSRGEMPLKEVIQHFKAFMSTKEEKQAFLKMVPRVATLADKGSGKQVARLKESTLTEYKLE